MGNSAALTWKTTSRTTDYDDSSFTTPRVLTSGADRVTEWATPLLKALQAMAVVKDSIDIPSSYLLVSESAERSSVSEDWLYLIGTNSFESLVFDTTGTIGVSEDRLLRLIHPAAVLNLEEARQESAFAKQRIAELAVLQPDWDDEGATPQSAESVNEAIKLIDNAVARFGLIVGASAVPWTIGPAHFGGLMPEWRGPGGELEVLIGPNGEKSYLMIHDDGDEEQYIESDHSSGSELLSAIADILFE